MSKERRNIEKLYDVIKRPIITEKSMMATALGKYTFEVQKDATKAVSYTHLTLPTILRV